MADTKEEMTIFLDVYPKSLAVFDDADHFTPVKMEFKDDTDKELVKMVLRDPNFWVNFLASLSAAITNQRERA